MTTANTHGARRNDGPVDNVKQGVFSGEARTITAPSIQAIRGSNGGYPLTSGVTKTSFALGAGHPAPHG